MMKKFHRRTVWDSKQTRRRQRWVVAVQDNKNTALSEHVLFACHCLQLMWPVMCASESTLPQTSLLPSFMSWGNILLLLFSDMFKALNLLFALSLCSATFKTFYPIHMFIVGPVMGKDAIDEDIIVSKSHPSYVLVHACDFVIKCVRTWLEILPEMVRALLTSSAPAGDMPFRQSPFPAICLSGKLRFWQALLLAKSESLPEKL